VTPPLGGQDVETLKSITAASLLRGVVYGEESPRAWQALTNARIRIWLADYFRTLGLTVVLDEADQYAYLRTTSDLPEGMPRLIRRHQLTFRMSVLLALLRERLDETARDGQADRTVVSHEHLLDAMRPFHDKTVTDDKIGQDITNAVAADYLRKLSGTDPVSYEIRRHVKSLVTADWLAQFHDRISTATPPADLRLADGGGTTPDAAEPAAPGRDDVTSMRDGGNR
jgi:hypothetical protein